MSTTELYRLDAGLAPNTFVVKKFDDDLNLQSEWIMSANGHGTPNCNCWQGQKGWCRHQAMWTALSAHIGDGWLYDRARDQWMPPPEA